MKKKVLSQLYDDAVINDRTYVELIDDEVYEGLRAEFQKLYDKLLIQLNDEQKQLMDSVYEAYMKVAVHEEEAAFKYGMSLGTSIMTEAFEIMQKTIDKE